MSTTIKEIAKAHKASHQPVQSEKVSRFLKLRFKIRRRADAVTGAIVEKAAQMNPRKSQEDYLRAEQRLSDLIERATDDPMLKADPAVGGCVTAGNTAIQSESAKVDAAQAQGQRPEYGDARNALKSATDKLDHAIDAAQKRCGKHADANPALKDTLDLLQQTIDDPQIRATATEVEGWRKAHAAATEAFYKPNADLKKVDTLAGALMQKIGGVVNVNGAQAKQVQEKREEIELVMARSTAPVEALAPINTLLKRAMQEASGQDYAAALQTLAAAKQALPQPVPKVGAVPDMAAIEQRRKDLFDKGRAALGGTLSSEPAKAKTRAMMQTLETLAPLCQQAGGVEVEALRRVEACEREYDAVVAADKDANAFAREKREVWQPMIEGKLATLGKALAAAPQDGAIVGLAFRLTALATSYKADWPKLMTMKEVDDSGVLREATAIDEAYDAWKAEQKAGGGARGWEQQFHDASGALAQVTDRVREADIGMLKSLGLLTKMPALVERGGALLLAPDKAKAEAEVRAITQTLMDTVNVARTRLDNAPKLDDVVKQGQALIDDYTSRIDAQVAALEALQPGKKMAKAKSALRAIRESAFSDDGERAARIQYAAALKERLDGLGNLLSCPNATAAQGALADLRAAEQQVRDMEAMGKGGNAPKTKQGDAPPSFQELQTRIKAVQKMLAANTKDGDLGTRVDTLKDWSTRASDLAEQLGEADPRAIEAEVGALEREIVETTARHKEEISHANAQINAVTALLLKVMDARKKGSPLEIAFGPLLASVQRQGEIIRKNVLHAKVEDASFDDWQKEATSLLNASRPAAETEALKTRTGEAVAEDQAVEAARKSLLRMRDVELKLALEQSKSLTDKDKTATIKTLVGDLKKEVARALDALDENRNPDTVAALVGAMQRELAQTAFGAGDEITDRGELGQLDAKWQSAIDQLKAQLDQLVIAVRKAAETEAQDVQQAAEALEKGAVAPVVALFGKGMFSAGIKGMASKDAKARAVARETVLGDIRRLRRVIEGDSRVRLLLDNPFGTVVPLPEIGSRLLDIEINVTRARGG